MKDFSTADRPIAIGPEMLGRGPYGQADHAPVLSVVVDSEEAGAPVMTATREGLQAGAEQALVNRVPRAANRSRFGCGLLFFLPCS